MNKLKAGGIHLLLSALVIATFIVFLNFFWYQSLMRVTGVVEPLKLLVIIDVVVGPLLTFIVYKQGKKTLKLDLSVIVLMQLAAFGYGAFIIYQGKPSWLVFNDNAFEIVYQKEIPSNDNALQNNGVFSTPKLAYIPYANQRMGVSAHNNFSSAEEFKSEDWDKINFQKITLKEAAVLTDLNEIDIESKINGQDIELYRLNNDGLMSVLIFENKKINGFSVLTQFH